MNEATAFVREFIARSNQQEISSRLPVGNELLVLLRCWLDHAEDACQLKYSSLMFLKWAISGRAQEVLDVLDASDNGQDALVAQYIRHIAARDRTSRGVIAHYAYAYYGWLGKELGNQTWVQQSLPDNVMG